MRPDRLLIPLVVVVAIVSVACTVVADMGDNGSISDIESYTISYRLDGGSFDDDIPHSYVTGSYMNLPIPVKEGYWFAGWCTEEALSNPIGGITGNLRGHTTLYAKWMDDDRTGLGWMMDVTGSYRNGTIPHEMSGTFMAGYDRIVDGKVLYRSERDIVYSWPDGAWRDESTSFSWMDRITDGWLYVDTVTYQGERLTVWEEDGTRMYLRDMTVPIRIEAPVGTNGSVVYELDSTFKYRPPSTYVPLVSCEYPLSLENPGKVRAGDDLTLTVEGDGFDGWYVNGILVSDEPSHTFKGLVPSDSIEARSSVSYVVVSNAVEVNDLGFQGAVFYDDKGDVLFDTSGLDPGLYHGVLRQDGVKHTIDFVVDGIREFDHTWSFDDREYTISTTVHYSEIHAVLDDNPNLPRFNIGSQNQIEAFHATEGDAIEEVHSQLESMRGDMGDRRFAEFVLSFVQSLPYVEDITSRGTDEYWKLPAETLWDGNGDCEDTTFLYGTLMGMSGYRVAFVLFKDHAMSAVDLGGMDETITIEGYAFTLVETISIHFGLGQTSLNHHASDSIFNCRVESF